MWPINQFLNPRKISKEESIKMAFKTYSVHLSGENDFAYNLIQTKMETIYHWLDEMKPFIKKIMLMYTLVALNNIYP